MVLHKSRFFGFFVAYHGLQDTSGGHRFSCQRRGRRSTYSQSREPPILPDSPRELRCSWARDLRHDSCGRYASGRFPPASRDLLTPELPRGRAKRRVAAVSGSQKKPLGDGLIAESRQYAATRDRRDDEGANRRSLRIIEGAKSYPRVPARTRKEKPRADPGHRPELPSFASQRGDSERPPELGTASAQRDWRVVKHSARYDAGSLLCHRKRNRYLRNVFGPRCGVASPPYSR